MNAHEAYLTERYPEISPRSFYRFIFPEGELEKRGEYVKGKYCGIIVSVTRAKKRDGRPVIKRYNLTDDLDLIDSLTASDDFCICAPLSYAGKARTAENARFAYGMAIDLDHIRTDTEGKSLGLANLMERHVEGIQRLPRPTFIVSSGTGAHLYFVFDQPIALFPDAAKSLQQLKRDLTTMCWHDTITDIRDIREVQQEGIFQGFRMPGTITKNGGRARAFITGGRVDLEYLTGFVRELREAMKYKPPRQRMPLKEAAERFPEWYERIQSKAPKGKSPTSRAVYDDWLRRIRNGATVGHRYNCLFTLAVMAKKCSFYDAKKNPHPVTREELERDCFSLLDHLEAMTETADNHFTAGDVLDALEAFDEKWITYPRAAIEYKSGIPIVPQIRRNGQKQKDHLQEARAIRDIRCARRGVKWDDNNGRKPQQETVRAWRQDHPDGKKADCARDTGLSRQTVYRWWDTEKQ